MAFDNARLQALMALAAERHELPRPGLGTLAIAIGGGKASWWFAARLYPYSEIEISEATFCVGIYLALHYIGQNGKIKRQCEGNRKLEKW